MSTITTTTVTSSSPAVAADRQEAARQQAALTRLRAAVVTLRAWRQLAPPPTRPAADKDADHDAWPGAPMP